MDSIGDFVRLKRKQAGLTQVELALKTGVGLRFVRDLEGDKPTVRLDKVEMVLKMFGHRIGAVPMVRDLK